MSPTTGKFALRFLFNSDASMSMWTIVPFLQNSSNLPVTRSSKRTPNASSKSAPSFIFTIGSLKDLRSSYSPFTAQFAEAEPCMPSQRNDSGCVSGKTADAHERRRHGNVRRLGEFFQFRRRAARNDSAAAVKHRTFGLFDEADDFVQRDVVCASNPAACSRAGLF